MTSPKKNTTSEAASSSCHPIGNDVFTAAREKLGAIQLSKVAKELEKRGFLASIVPTIKDAADLVLNTILPESGATSVAFGGSMTVIESGLYDTLKASPTLKFMDTLDASIGMPALLELRHEALLADFYLASVNALTKDGTLMLIDGIGNRTASVQFGPRKVVLLVGRNKLCEDIEAGFTRIKTISAPANALRLSRNTPCTQVGYCMDCKLPESICAVWAIIRRCAPAGRIHLVLINEDLGF